MRILMILAFTLMCTTAHAHEFAAAEITIHHPYAYEAQKGATQTKAFMTITNDGDDHDHLLRATSPIASSIDIMDGDNKLNELEIAEHQSVKFKPDGIHLVLNGIQKPIAINTRKPITLFFEHAGAFKAQLLFSKSGGVSLCDDGHHHTTRQ